MKLISYCKKSEQQKTNYSMLDCQNTDMTLRRKTKEKKKCKKKKLQRKEGRKKGQKRGKDLCSTWIG